MLKKIKLIVRKSVPMYYHKHIEYLLQLYRESYNYLKYLMYFGSNVKCPCCGKSSRIFLPFNKKYPNVMCPRCGSHERHRLMWLYLENKTKVLSKINLPEKVKVLHFAPEYFISKKLIQYDHIDYVSTDLCSSLAMVKFDITDIPYKDNLFNVILCSHVLEHVEDDRKAMQELFRVLKKGGWAILQVPIDRSRHETFEDPNINTPEDRLRFYGEPDHMRFYGLDYKDKLEKAGFLVKVDNYVKELESDLIKKYGLDVNEDIYFCQKT